MGKKLRDEDLQLNIIVNGNKAMKELGELEQRNKSLKETNKQLRLEKAKLDKTDKNYRQELNRLNNTIKKNNVEIKQNDNRMSQLRKKVGLTSLTYSQLSREARRLDIALKNSTPGTAQWHNYNNELKKVKGRMKELRTGAIGTNKSFGKMADGFNRYFGMITAGVAAITGVVFSIKQWITGNVDLADSLADVQKTTGMTKKEVRDLYSEFKYLNTRTPRKELLALAEEAGRLGKKSKKDVMAFVDVANQIKVALGDDLGGNAEEAIREVGKLTEIFGVGQKYGVDFRQSMLMVGSSINEVSANSQAQASYLIDFTKRLSGISNQANISVQDIIGFASTLDESGQAVEMSATAINQVIIKMFEDTATYAEIAGMGVDEFKNLLNKDANEAFLKLLEGLNGNNEGLSVMAAKLDALGVDGARATQVLASLASSTDKIRDRQSLANKSLEEATSLTNEYNTKNENLAGNVERIGRGIRAWFINSKLVGWLENVAGWMAKLFEIKLSDKMRDEQVQVNALAMQLTDANIPAERRNQIYKELKGIAPDVLKGIERENIEIEKLKTNLAGYNEQMIKKIAIQQSQENLEEAQEKAGKSMSQIIKDEQKLSEEMVKVKDNIKEVSEEYAKRAEDILMSDQSVYEKGVELKNLIKQMDEDEATDFVEMNELKKKTIQSTFGFTLAGLKGQLDNYKNALKEANDQARRYEESYQSIYGLESDDSNKIKNSFGKMGSVAARQFSHMFKETIGEDGAGSNYDNMLKNIEKQHKRKKLLLTEQRAEDKITQKQYNNQLNLLDVAYLESKKGLLLYHKKDATDIEISIAQKKIAIAQSYYKQQLDDIKVSNTMTETELLNSFMKREISEEEYHQRKRQLELKHLEDQKQLMIENGEEVVEIERQIAQKKLAIDEENRRERLAKLKDDYEAVKQSFSEDEALFDEQQMISFQKMAEAYSAAMDEELNAIQNTEYYKTLTVKEQEEERSKIRNKYDKKLKTQLHKQFQYYTDIAGQVGTEFGNFLGDQQYTMDKFSTNMILMGLDFLHKQLQMAIAKATFQSLASPESIATFGAAGLAKAALLTGLMEAAFAVVKSSISSSLNSDQAYEGRYPVKGNQDGKMYDAKKLRDPETGEIKEPTLLVGELPEYVIDPQTTEKIRKERPDILDTILYYAGKEAVKPVNKNKKNIIKPSDKPAENQIILNKTSINRINREKPSLIKEINNVAGKEIVSSETIKESETIESSKEFTNIVLDKNTIEKIQEIKPEIVTTLQTLSAENEEKEAADKDDTIDYQITIDASVFDRLQTEQPETVKEINKMIIMQQMAAYDPGSEEQNKIIPAETQMPTFDDYPPIESDPFYKHIEIPDINIPEPGFTFQQASLTSDFPNNNVQMNYPGVIQAIQASRIPPDFKNNPVIPAKNEIINNEKTFSDPEMISTLNRFSSIVERLEQKGLKAFVVMDQDYIENHNDIFDKYNDTLNDVNMS